MKDLVAFFKKDKFNLLVLILSIIILIIGIFVVGFLISLLVFIVINLFWILPFIKWKKKLDNRKKAKKKNKEEILDEEADKVSMALEERSENMAKKGRKSKNKKKGEN